MDFKIEDLFLGFADVDGCDPADGRLAAFKVIAASFTRGQLPSQELMEWFCNSVEALSKRHDGATTLARRKTAIATAFGYTKGSGRPAKSEQEYYEIAKDVHRIKRANRCSDEKALGLYIAKNPESVKSEESTEWIGEIYKKYKKMLVHDYQEWEADMAALEDSERRRILWLIQSRGVITTRPLAP